MNSLSVDEALLGESGASTQAKRVSLADCVRQSIQGYFNDLNGHAPGNLYQMVMREVERPLLESVMEQVHGNQTKAAAMLGITRSTLRKKLAQHGLHG